ncbi:unnamed protein product [Ostreobium quekettii]|uniref:Uncharacterized protein n=1 Tax=Ostreobium quekettii TaxID=121088 RepID=A0A8S1J1Y5_9CHLO|nr:unnamed protein product [Ostreobium quekettii]|eukprot:evm.model.scf_37.13 EVM.evm.TU.scf_37.13   scf_37:96120-103447(+)
MGEGNNCRQMQGAPEPCAADMAPHAGSADSQGHGLYPSPNLPSDNIALSAEVERLRSEKQSMEAALQSQIAMRQQAEELHAQAERVMAKSVFQGGKPAPSIPEEETAVYEQLKEEKQARLRLEAEVKRFIAEMKNEDGIRLSSTSGLNICEELEQLHDVSRQLSAGLEDERARRKKAESSLDVTMGELAHADKNRSKLQAEMKELRSRLHSQLEIKSQVDAVKEQTRREIDLVMRRSKGEIDEECRQRMKAEGALDEVLKEITESELARRKAEIAQREACRSLESERKARKRVEEERRNLEGVAREHHRRRSQAEAASSQLRAEVEALRKECDRLRHGLKDEKQQRDVAETAWKETARRLHGERAMYAYWVKKQNEFQGKGCNEVEEIPYQDADTNWMDQARVDSGIPRHTRRLARLEEADPEGIAATGLAMPPSAQSEWDAAPRTAIAPTSALGCGTMSFDGLKASHRWQAGNRPLAVDYRALEIGDAYRSGIGTFALGTEDIALAQQGASQGPFRWLRHLSPLRPAKWVVSHRGDITHHTGKVLQNFWTWVIVVGVVAGTIGLGDSDDGDERKSDREAIEEIQHGPPHVFVRGGGGTIYGADSFMG